jgi:hypothetical protein
MADAHDDALTRLRAERHALLTELRRRGLELRPLPDLAKATIARRLAEWQAELERRRREGAA